MPKGQKRGNREIRKPKQKKATPEPADLFANQTRLAANTNTQRANGKARDGRDVLCGRRSAMKVVIEFYRIRDADNAHAVIGQETAEAADLDDAIEIAQQLSKSLDMPQQPDAMSIRDHDGNEHYVHKFDCTKRLEESLPPAVASVADSSATSVRYPA
jgi:hypothetical protein